MFLRIFYLCVFVSVTHQTFLKYLPTSDDLRESRVNSHRQALCMIKVGQEMCYNGTKIPGEAAQVAEIFQIIKYGRGKSPFEDPENKDNNDDDDDDDDVDENDAEESYM